VNRWGTVPIFNLNDLVRRDRDHPGLVIWGLLNENTAGRFYQTAKAWLPSLRAVDDTRLVLINSGRWDCDLKTASASNPGSTAWDAYLGGEGPAASAASGGLGDDPNAYRNPGGADDVHVYQRYPTTWSFIEAFAELGRNTRPVFVSEGGLGSSFNAIRAEGKMREAHVPDNAPPWRWMSQGAAGLRQTWPKCRLETLYPFQFQEGVMLGVYDHHAGKLTPGSLQVARMLGHPAEDRLLLNMVARARTTAAPATDQPPSKRTELDRLVGQSVDIAPWAYSWRADLAVQEKPEAYFIPRRLERMDRVYRTAFYEMPAQELKEEWIDCREAGGTFALGSVNQ
jgi:hypothetical protein